MDYRHGGIVRGGCAGRILPGETGMECGGDYRLANRECTGGYYSQQQFLRNLDVRTLPAVSTEQPGIADEAYNEFIMQLAAYDTRRDFWLQSDYYKQRQEGDARADAALLDELVNNVQFTPRDDKKVPNDGVKLTAETAADANHLLRQYVAFASHRAAQHLNEEIQGAWAARTTSMKAQVKRQEAVADAVYKRELNTIEQALKIADTQGISRTQTDTPAEQLPDSDSFLLGKPMLQARLEGLQASGPTYDLDYDQNRAMLSTLNVGPTLDEKFQTYRYLRTPEEPVKRDSPRRVFWLIMWARWALWLAQVLPWCAARVIKNNIIIRLWACERPIRRYACD